MMADCPLLRKKNPAMSEKIDPEFLSYRPSAYYFREALRDSHTVEDAVEVGMQVVREPEELKAWVREQGLIPPRRHIMNAEAEAKQLKLL